MNEKVVAESVPNSRFRKQFYSERISQGEMLLRASDSVKSFSGFMLQPNDEEYLVPLQDLPAFVESIGKIGILMLQVVCTRRMIFHDKVFGLVFDQIIGSIEKEMKAMVVAGMPTAGYPALTKRRFQNLDTICKGSCRDCMYSYLNKYDGRAVVDGSPFNYLYERVLYL